MKDTKEMIELNLVGLTMHKLPEPATFAFAMLAKLDGNFSDDIDNDSIWYGYIVQANEHEHIILVLNLLTGDTYTLTSSNDCLALINCTNWQLEQGQAKQLPLCALRKSADDFAQWWLTGNEKDGIWASNPFAQHTSHKEA